MAKPSETKSNQNPDQRRIELENWALETLNQFHPSGEWQLSVVCGDASQRRYFRAKHLDAANAADSSKPNSVILMDDPANDESLNCFIQIAKRLRAASVNAPQIFAEDQERGFLVLEDFGDQLLKAELNRETGDSIFNNDIAPLLAQLQQTDHNGLNAFDQDKIQQELDLFNHWHCDRHLGQAFVDDEILVWQKLCKQLVETLEEIPRCFIHLDFHSCNLLRCPDSTIGVIDFQDARSGPLTYDLASWLWDRYIGWPRQEIKQWSEQARQLLCPETDNKIWQRWVDFTGLQRSLKVVGIFARLHYRDKKQGYLEMAPRFEQYILDICGEHPELKFCLELLNTRLLQSPSNKGTNNA